jgi:hypothetical protein
VLNYFNDDIFFNSDVSNRDNIKIQAIRRWGKWERR